ncbi:hypothetical protein ACVJGC_002148 [Bradyrhizobium diazoefficiens]
MKGLRQRIGHGHVGDRQRAVAAVILVGAARLALGLLEIGQHVVIAPAGVAALAPAVIVLVLAANIEQAVDRARAAQRLTARLEHLAPLQLGLRLGLVHPVDRLLLEQLAVAERHVDPDVGILRAGLEQQHAVLAVRRQAVGEHAAGGAGADDDVVEFGIDWCERGVCGHVLPVFLLVGVSVSSLTTIMRADAAPRPAT